MLLFTNKHTYTVHNVQILIIASLHVSMYTHLRVYFQNNNAYVNKLMFT